MFRPCWHDHSFLDALANMSKMTEPGPHLFTPGLPGGTARRSSLRRASLHLTDPLMRKLQTFSTSELKTRQKKIESLSLELGMHFNLPKNSAVMNNDWQLDILPFVIPPGEWKVLEAGLIQRMRAFGRFLSDIYSGQRIFKDRILPYELIFNDPGFLRQCVGIQPGAGEERHLILAAVDLVRDQEGQWMATQQHCSIPMGLSHVIQHRRMLNQSFPELFESMNVQPVFSFSTELVEALSNLSDKPSPHIVLLSSGNIQENDFEDTFLARRMGIAVVNPGDLIVREGRVFLKTIGGLEQVDVIYRRALSRTLDPITFGAKGGSGIPGLVNCARKGTVAIANSIGNGIADNKSLLRYSDRIIQFYLGEQAILKSVPTYICADRDQLDYVKANRESMLLKPIHQEGDLNRIYRPDKRAEYQKKMELLLEQSPEDVVAQPYINASTASRFENGKMVPRPLYLRAFVLLGSNPIVLPGGLTRQSIGSDAHRYIADLSSGAKDTWVPAHEEKTQKKRQPIVSKQSGLVPRDFKIASRVAESLYWIGRYTERAENTARMVRIMDEFGWKQLGRSQKLNLWPLWQGVAASTGNHELLKKSDPPRDIHTFGLQLAVNPKNSASIPYCINIANQNAMEIREYITPEVWAIMSRLQLIVSDIPSLKEADSTTLQELCLKIADAIAGFNGTFHRTMPHDESWEFFQLGYLVERAICTVTMLDTVLSRALINLEPGRLSDPDLTVLLRLLGSLDAYQREYRSRTHPGQVAELLWRNHQTPSSVAFCCLRLSYSLGNILQMGKIEPSASEPYQTIKTLSNHLESIRIATLFPQTAFDEDILLPVRRANLKQMVKRVEQEGSRLQRMLSAIHEQIEDDFFSHQTRVEQPTLL